MYGRYDNSLFFAYLLIDSFHESLQVLSSHVPLLHLTLFALELHKSGSTLLASATKLLQVALHALHLAFHALWRLDDLAG